MGACWFVMGLCIRILVFCSQMVQHLVNKLILFLAQYISAKGSYGLSLSNDWNQGNAFVLRTQSCDLLLVA